MGGVYVANDRGWAETISSEAVGTHGGEPALVTIQYVKGSADLDEDEIVSTISDAVQKVLIDLSHQVPDDYEADMSYPGRGWAADQMIANPQDAADMIATKTVELLSNFSAPRNAAKDIIKQMALRLLMQTKDINDPGERVRAMSFNAYDTFRDEMEELLAKLMIQVSPDTPNNSADTRRINRDIKFKGKTRIIQIESPVGKIVYKDPNYLVDNVTPNSVYSNSKQRLGEEAMETKQFNITPELKKLDKMFTKAGYDLRVVGGAVRDLALGNEPKDIDLATNATPTEMQKMFDSASVKHIPSGIEHGTITAIINSEEFEITTLRTDVETDGRHAEVEFVRSWEEDALRRDLTYNAMSMDFAGTLYDYHGGMDDLQNKVSRFVGDPAARIQEDYLRILRYFRFQGRLANPKFETDTLQAVKDNAAGLKQVSVERVWMEMGKILSGDNVAKILAAMSKTNILKTIELPTQNINSVKDNQDALVNLARLGDATVGKKWKMSKVDSSTLAFLVANKDTKVSKQSLTSMMADGVDRNQLSKLAMMQGKDNLQSHIQNFVVPQFPVTGNDLMKLGHTRGPGIGKTLQSMRDQWKKGNFDLSKDDLLKSVSKE
jgi:tRNA nucleotidyltransferase (CCA-adding enzyme)|tara:strand:+ start:677 stop:2494 length:1818 start_codon:yes stop_codon:yes gene_type:complete